MLPDGFEQLELFKTSPAGELIPTIDYNSDDSEKGEDKQWQGVTNIAKKNKTER